jgi:hypothetical protein
MKKNILIATTLASAILSGSAYAASGEVENVSTGQLNRVEVKIGADTYSVVHFKLVLVVNKSTVPAFKVGDVHSINCVGISNTINQESIGEGNCLGKDSAGDSYTTTFRRKGVVGQPGAGNQTVKGLTGKFAGLDGSCTYEVKYTQNDGLYLASFAKCSYK